MFIALSVLHLLISLVLVILILTQSSKGGALEGLVGNHATSMMGGQANDFFKKWTRVLGVAFFISCVALAITVKNSNIAKRSTSALDKLKRQEAVAPQTQETVPTTVPAATEDAAPAEAKPAETE